MEDRSEPIKKMKYVQNHSVMRRMFSKQREMVTIESKSGHNILRDRKTLRITDKQCRIRGKELSKQISMAS
jgi:hypothetical protein